MDDLITKLATARKVLAHEKDAQDALNRDIETAFGKRRAMIASQLSAAKDTVATLEGKVRTAGLSAYKATGSKTPHDALQVKVYKVVSILGSHTADDLFAFARDHLPSALKLDRRAFDKSAKELLGMDLEITKQLKSLVTIQDDPRVTIKRDLGGY